MAEAEEGVVVTEDEATTVDSGNDPQAVAIDTTGDEAPQKTQGDIPADKAFATALEKRLAQERAKWERSDPRIQGYEKLRRSGIDVEKAVATSRQSQIDALIAKGHDAEAATAIVDDRIAAASARADAEQARVDAQLDRLLASRSDVTREEILAFGQKLADERGDALSLQSVVELYDAVHARESGEQAAKASIEAAKKATIPAGKGAGGAKPSLASLDPNSPEFKALEEQWESGKSPI